MNALQNRISTVPPGTASPGRSRQLRLAFESVLLFAGVPVLYAVGLAPIPVIVLLVLMAAGCWVAWRLEHRAALRDSWRVAVPGTEWRRVLSIYMVAIPLLVFLLLLTKPSALFSLLLKHPKIWFLVMFAYPIISVLPQEFVYRVFFFERYRPLFGHGLGMISASAVAFSFGHIVFHDWPAVGLTLLGGILFGRTYQRAGSLKLVVIEHALYGWAIFTIGYGEFFFEGTLRLFH